MTGTDTDFLNYIFMRVCQNTLLITEDRYIAELSYEVAI